MTVTDDGAGNPKTPTGEGPMPRSLPPTSEPSPQPDLLSVTIDAKTGQITKVESVDAAGVRRELSDQKKADLVKEKGEDTFEALLEQAFEAGIACVLGGGTGQDDGEDEEEADLRHLLLRQLIRRSPAERLMRRDVLSRAILGTVIRDTMNPSSPDAASNPAQQRPRGSASR
jgi:hypothetical protein